MKYDLQTREEICAILRPYILCKYGNELVGKTYKEKEEGTNSDLSLERKITKSQIKNFVKKNIKTFLNDKQFEFFNKLFLYGDMENSTEYETWEKFLRGDSTVVQEGKLKAMIIAFQFPGYERILDVQTENAVEVVGTTKDHISYFVGHFYSSLVYNLTKCFLKLNYSKNEAEFYYVDQENGKKIRDDRHYSGKITERRSISLSDGNKNAQMILAGDPTESSLNGFSAIWIKEHRPEGNEGSKYETMCRILFQRINVETEENARKAVCNYPTPPVGLLSEVSSCRFDKKPYFINDRKNNIKKRVNELPGKYELFQILLDGTSEDDSKFSCLKLEITKELEVRLYDTHDEVKQGFFVEHPSKLSTIILCFPPKPDRSRDEYILIIFHIKKNCSDYKGVITETCDGFPFCGAVYIRRNEEAVPARISMEDMKKIDNFDKIINFFIGPKELGTKHRVVSLAQLQEIDKYYKDNINNK